MTLIATYSTSVNIGGVVGYSFSSSNKVHPSKSRVSRTVIGCVGQPNIEISIRILNVKHLLTVIKR